MFPAVHLELEDEDLLGVVGPYAVHVGHPVPHRGRSLQEARQPFGVVGGVAGRLDSCAVQQAVVSNAFVRKLLVRQCSH